MDTNLFLKNLELTKKILPHLPIRRAYNSIGSHVFFKAGKQTESVLPNGRTITSSEWTIWLANTSWRITQNDLYITSSQDSQKNIQATLLHFLESHLTQIFLISRYADIALVFSNGYTIHTFFNWTREGGKVSIGKVEESGSEHN